MIVHDFDALGTVGRPAETGPPLPVDPDRILPVAVTSQSFEPIARRRTKVIETNGSVQHIQLPQRDVLNGPPPRGTNIVAKQPLCRPVGEASDHKIVCDTDRVSVKGIGGGRDKFKEVPANLLRRTAFTSPNTARPRLTLPRPPHPAPQSVTTAYRPSPWDGICGRHSYDERCQSFLALTAHIGQSTVAVSLLT